jgi:SAM-dependent methyltransferase
MNETSKSRKLWGTIELSALRGSGIDIGCGPDPVTPEARRFDIADGDANRITEFVHERFDYVYASHCLEHMHRPADAVLEWWRLVKPGGHLFFLVPDEDLYEQGVFPSRFNDDHKATFTISKARSWSPVSINVLDLARSLPDGELIRLVLQDHGYDRCLLRHGPDRPPILPVHLIIRAYNYARRHSARRLGLMEAFKARFFAIDQTSNPDTVAQIECIVRKRDASRSSENASVARSAT